MISIRVISLSVLCVFFTVGCNNKPAKKALFKFPNPQVTGEQYLPDGSIPPPRELYSLPSVRQLPTEVLWRYITDANGIVIVGVKDREPRGYFRGRVLVEQRRVDEIKSQLQHEIGGLRLAKADRPVPTLVNGQSFPVFRAHLGSIEALAALRRSPLVEYVEPGYFMDSLACTQNPYESKAIASADGKLQVDDAAGNRESGVGFDIVPYPFQRMGIVSAWRRLIYGTGEYPGRNMMVGVLDSGASSDQDQLNGNFILGSSRPQAIHLTANGVSPYDSCGHGTRIAGLAAAPRDGNNIIGVVWGAPLVTVKVDESPLVWGGRYTVDVSAICDGIAKARAIGARVISMAFGLLYTSPTISQCIQNAYDEAPEVIFVAAAGTTTSWVVFPAVMNREVLAVSLVEINPSGGFKMLPFSQVAYGSDVDFVTPITTDDVPSTGLHSGQVWSLGGSSAATAQVAGLVSLVWSRFHSEPRDKIIQLMKESSSIEGITDEGGLPPFSQVGAGIPNAYRAIGGATRIDVNGPTEGTPGSTVQLQAVSNGTDDQLAYTWSPGSVTGRSISVTLQQNDGDVKSVSVEAWDFIAQVKLSATHTIRVRASVSPPSVIKLYSSDRVLEYPVFFDGNRVDRTINGGVEMAPGCAVTALNGVRICHSVFGQPWYTCSDEVPAASGGPHDLDPSLNDVSAWGFVASRDPSADPRDLTAHFHVWHDGVTEIRVRAVYTVSQPAAVDCSVSGKTQGTPF